MKYMAVIRISGNHGAGKTTLGRRLAEHLGYRYENTGMVFRKIAAERGLSIEEFYASLQNNRDLERQINDQHAELMKVVDNLVIDSRTMHLHDTPFPACSILLTVRPEIGATRIHLNNPEKYPSVEFALEASRNRLAVEVERYRYRYGVPNFLDPQYFDIAVDTSDLTPNEVFESILHSSPIKNIV